MPLRPCLTMHCPLTSITAVMDVPDVFLRTDITSPVMS